jgi:ribosome-interacting GTPase 1
LLAKFKFATITGPSSKFPNQMVGLDHILKDEDIVELKLEK